MANKRQVLINTALTLFYQKGIQAVGINEVLHVSGVAKKTLYNHFASKDALILETLKHRDFIYLNWLKCHLEKATTNTELVCYLFDALTQWFTNSASELGDFRGCFFINTSAEFSDSDGEIGRYCRVHKENERQLIYELMPVKDTELLDLICFLKEGTIVCAYVNQDIQAAENCRNLLLPKL